MLGLIQWSQNNDKERLRTRNVRATKKIRNPAVRVEPQHRNVNVGNSAYLACTSASSNTCSGLFWSMPPASQQVQTYRHTSNQKKRNHRQPTASPESRRTTEQSAQSQMAKHWLAHPTHITTLHTGALPQQARPVLGSAPRHRPALTAARVRMSCARAPAAQTAAPTARCKPRALPHHAHRPARLLHALDLVLHLHVQLLEPVELVVVRVPVATAARL